MLNKLLYLTGGRISEVPALRWSHIYATDKGGEMKIIRGKGRIATQLLDAGAPLHKVSSFLDHSDPKITVKAYYSEAEGLKVEDFIDVE